jgi:DNA adenine methylase
VLRDDFEEFNRLVQLYPYSRQEYYNCRENWEKEPDKIKRAAMWFVIARQSFGGNFSESWSFGVNTKRRNICAQVSKHLSIVELLPPISNRLQQIQVENLDFKKCIITYDTPNTLFYCDPPYLHETRSKDKGYTHEMSTKDHMEFLETITNIKGKSIISGYPSEFYSGFLQGWQCEKRQVICSASGATKGTSRKGKGGKAQDKRIECLWISPNAENQAKQLELFD